MSHRSNQILACEIQVVLRIASGVTNGRNILPLADGGPGRRDSSLLLLELFWGFDYRRRETCINVPFSMTFGDLS